MAFLKQNIVTRNWREARGALLTVDAVGWGASYWLGPHSWRDNTATAYINSLPGGLQLFGLLMFLFGLGLFLGRFRLPTLMRVSHSFLAGLYFLFGLGLVYGQVGYGMHSTGNPFSFLHYLILAWLNYSSGIESPTIPVLRRRSHV